MNDSIEENGKITTRTKIPLGMVALILVSSVSATISIFAFINSVRAEFTAKMAELEARTLKLETVGTANRWTSADMQLFCSELERENPSLRVPTVRDIKGQQ